MYRAAKRDKNEKKIVDFLRRLGASVEFLDGSGIPDLLVAWQGQNLLMEVKGEKGKLTKPQENFFEKWEAPAYIVRDVDDVKNVLRCNMSDFERYREMITKDFGDRLPDPARVSWSENIFKWRAALKYWLWSEREGRSDLSGEILNHSCHMHEGILTRGDLRGVRWQYLIFHPYNCFLLKPEEHIPEPPSREWAVLKSCSRYGEKNVVEWFNNLPFKVKPFRIEGFLE